MTREGRAIGMTTGAGRNQFHMRQRNVWSVMMTLGYTDRIFYSVLCNPSSVLG